MVTDAALERAPPRLEAEVAPVAATAIYWQTMTWMAEQAVPTQHPDFD
jgi:hypothetical protein